MYCLKCKKDTKDSNIKAFMTKNDRYILKANCNICKSKNPNLFQKRNSWIWFSFKFIQ